MHDIQRKQENTICFSHPGNKMSTLMLLQFLMNPLGELWDVFNASPMCPVDVMCYMYRYKCNRSVDIMCAAASLPRDLSSWNDLTLQVTMCPAPVHLLLEACVVPPLQIDKDKHTQSFSKEGSKTPRGDGWVPFKTAARVCACVCFWVFMCERGTKKTQGES